MKKIILIVVFALVFKYGYSQFELSLMPKVGYNAVDIEKATGTLKYENTTSSTYLNSWNQFHYGVAIQGIFNNGNKINYGGELSYHRLYYWEEAYYTSYGTRYRWGDVSTIGLEFLAKYNLTDLFYLKPGIGLQHFTDGSGTTVGLAEAAGVEIKISDKLAIPVEFRSDQIFGHAVSILLSLGFGLRASF